MNLVYACVFYNPDYFKLLELLLLSMRMYSSTDTFDIVVLTSPEFESRLNELSNKIGLKVTAMCIKLTTIFEAACARLRIFDYADISRYEKILYLDTDIIIKGDLAPLFSLATEDKLYGIEQGTIASMNFGRQFFKTSGLDFNITGINSGTLLFKNCLAIRDLFSRIRGHINAFTDTGEQPPYTLDQPFINYHAIRDSAYDNHALNNYVSLYENSDVVSNYATSMICHFSYPIGNFAHKYNRMKAFFLKLLTSPAVEVVQFENKIIGKKYDWERAYIYFYEGYLQTMWGRGSYDFRTPHIVCAQWHGFHHILKFSNDYSNYLSIRVKPDDLYYHSSKNYILDRIDYRPHNIFSRDYTSIPDLAICFIHSCHLLSAGTEKLDLVLEAAIGVKELHTIVINNIGLPLDISKYMALDNRIIVIQCSSEPTLFELPTLKLISEFSKQFKNAKVLYLHTKGISYGKDHEYYLPELDWINYMTHFLCKKSDECIKLLDTYDTLGCDYNDVKNYAPPHYAGNFWWATSKYINTLTTDDLVDRTSAEWWILSGNANKYILHQSNRSVFNWVYYKTRYPESMYTTKIVNNMSLDNTLRMCVINKAGLEIGGPSESAKLSVYPYANLIDNVIFSKKTVWHNTVNNEFKYYRHKIGKCFINDSTDIYSISDNSYDFIYASHTLEHVANPIKALKEWLRIIKNDGYIILVLPDKMKSFDHNREYSKFTTIRSQYENGIGEDDLSTLSEILEKHDLSMDSPAGTFEQFKLRSLDNYNNRCLHHYVYNEALLNEICTFLNCSTVYSENTNNGNIWFIMKKG